MIVAVEVTPQGQVDPTWLNGPPYPVAEILFDEYDFEGCLSTEADLRADQDD